MTSTAITKKVYAGWIHLDNQGWEGPDDILCVLPEKNYDCYIGEDDTLARQIEEDIDKHGHYLSVQYYVSDVQLSHDELQVAWLNRLEGIGNADYAVHWSDITGYLWTDEEINVGGHDLLEELKAHAGKYLHLEIEYSERPRQ